jgi:hypothetical protein
MDSILLLRQMVLGALVPFVAGCGLSAYEAKMAAAQRRADEFDRKEVALGSAITPPDGCPVDIALRTPRGIVSQPDAVPQNGFFYRYGSVSGKGAVHEVLIGADTNARFARQAIQKTFPSATPLSVKSVEVPGQEAMSFESWTEGDGAGKTYIYLHQAGSLAAALAYRAGKADADTEAVIEASLKTLVLRPRRD